MTTYTCQSDRYDNDSTTVYDSVAEFLAMCLACFGESPRLNVVGDEWHDDQGVVLIPTAPSQTWTLYDYRTGDVVRPATADEHQESCDAAEYDGGRGVIEVEDYEGPCYVQ